MTGQTEDVTELICFRTGISDGKVTANTGGLKQREPEQHGAYVHGSKLLAGQRC